MNEATMPINMDPKQAQILVVLVRHFLENLDEIIAIKEKYKEPHGTNKKLPGVKNV